MINIIRNIINRKPKKQKIVSTKKNNNSFIYINEIIRILKKKGINMYPATKEDMYSLLIKSHGKKLPKAYIEFMEVMGRGTSGYFLRGESCFMNEVMDLDDWGKELIEECDFKYVLSDNDYVFWMSQGCMFCFFRLNEGDNPPVYFCTDAKSEEDNFYKIANTFTEFLKGMCILDKNVLVKKE